MTPLEQGIRAQDLQRILEAAVALPDVMFWRVLQGWPVYRKTEIM